MFRKTKIQLVSLYTLVFFLILCFLSIGLYYYMYRTTYAPLNEKLSEDGAAILQNKGKEIPEADERESERRVVYLFWGDKKNLIKIFPENSFFQSDFSKLYPDEHDDKWKDLSFGGMTYRSLTLKAHEMVINNQKVKSIQLVINITSEEFYLDKLLIMIVIGGAGSLILSFLAGLFLANKALVPIQRSWEKQSQFVADASHELRTPLAVIQTHLELLFRHPSNTIEQESERIYKSLSEVKRVNKLVGELLTLARTDSNEQLINPNPFWMNELLELIVEQFEPIAAMKEITLKGNIEDHLMFYGDKERMHQLSVILLDNALKYTPANGTISIICKKEGSFIKMIVEDTGIGIPEHDLPHIFDRFYRSDKVRSRSEGGTGLGLSIAKWIVEAHHGHITVESGKNKGTRFTIKIPIKESNLK